MTNNTERIFVKEYVLMMVINYLIAVNFISLLTTTPKYALDAFGSTSAEAGFAAGVFVIASVFSRVFAGRYATVVGYKKMLLIGILGITVASAGYFFAYNYILFLIVRIVHGLAFGIGTNMTITIVTSIIPKSRSGEGVGYYSLAQIVSLATGPLIALQLMQSGGMTGVFIFALVTPIVSFALSLALKIDPRTGEDAAETRETGILDRFVERRILPIAALCLLLYICYSSMLSFAAVYGDQIGLHPYTPYIFATVAIVTIASRPVVSRLFDRRGADTILYPGIAVLAAGFLFISLSSHGLTLLVSSGLIGFGIGAVQIGTLALLVNMVARERLSVANSTYYASIDIATGVGPVIVGALITAVGFREMYVVMACMTAAAIFVYYFLFTRKNRRGALLQK